MKKGTKEAKEISEQGHQARWSKRYEIIEYLSGKYDKQDLVKLLQWPTERLKWLAESFKKPREK